MGTLPMGELAGGQWKVEEEEEGRGLEEATVLVGEREGGALLVALGAGLGAGLAVTSAAGHRECLR